MSTSLGLYFYFIVISSADNCAEDGMFGNLMSFVFILSGTMMFQELMQTGGAKERRQLQELQKELQNDDPINIQFTSVSCIFNTTSIVESTFCTLRSFLCPLFVITVANKAINYSAMQNACVMRRVKINEN